MCPWQAWPAGPAINPATITLCSPPSMLMPCSSTFAVESFCAGAGLLPASCVRNSGRTTRTFNKISLCRNSLLNRFELPLASLPPDCWPRPAALAAIHRACWPYHCRRHLARSGGTGGFSSTRSFRAFFCAVEMLIKLFPASAGCAFESSIKIISDLPRCSPTAISKTRSRTLLASTISSPPAVRTCSYGPLKRSTSQCCCSSQSHQSPWHEKSSPTIHAPLRQTIRNLPPNLCPVLFARIGHRQCVQRLKTLLPFVPVPRGTRHTPANAPQSSRVPSFRLPGKQTDPLRLCVS